MSKKRTIIILGLFVALVPFLGLPREFRETLIVLAGLVIATLAFLLKRKLVSEVAETKNDTFSQNGSHFKSPSQNTDAKPTDR